jgi:hypothetical protein
VVGAQVLLAVKATVEMVGNPQLLGYPLITLVVEADHIMGLVVLVGEEMFQHLLDYLVKMDWVGVVEDHMGLLLLVMVVLG